MTPLQKIRRNFAKVVFGTSMASALNLGALAINTNALGVVTFGILVIIQTISELMAALLSFQTWQAINKFGAADVEAKDYRRLRQLFGVGLALDLLAAAFATASAVLAFLFIADWFGLPDDMAWLGIVYAVLSILQVRSASDGLLRLVDRFALSLGAQVVEAAVLVVNAAILAWLGAGLLHYVWTIALIKSVTGVALFALALRETVRLERQAALPVDAPYAGRVDAPAAERVDTLAFARFSLAVSFTTTITMVRMRGEVLFVSAVLGPAAAGLFAIASRGASIVGRLAEAGRLSVYPVLSLLLAEGRIGEARRTVMRATVPVAAVSLGIVILAALFGGDLLPLVFGPEFGDALPTLLWLMVGTLCASCLFAAAPFVQIHHGAGYFLRLTLISFVPFVIGMVAGPLMFGIAGAGIGTAAFGMAQMLIVVGHVITTPGAPPLAHHPVGRASRGPG